jgi:glycosyltransferase involved in cell wall biosynthesis
MYRNHKIGVAVPAYNEELLIGETLSGIPDYVDRIYVCNDASTDRTAEIVQEFAKKDGRIVLINHEKNTGVGGAIIDCYRKGLEEGMDIMAVMAGDNQMDPKELPKLLDPIVDGRADYAKGNRLYWREALRGMSKWRIFGNSMLTILTKIASGYWHISDPQNGYTAISKNALQRISLNGFYPWYGYCNDLLVKMNAYDLRVVDVPIPARYGNEKSKIRYRKYIPKLSWLLLRDFFWRMKIKYVVRNFHPLVFFYGLGILLAFSGLIAGIYSVVMKLLVNQLLFERLTISLIVFSIGMQFIFFAMYFDMQENRDLRERGSS